MSKLFFIVLFSFILAACSNKQLYQVGQDYQRSTCIEKAASAQQHNDCLTTDKKTYEEYDKEREEVINK